jgi:hypothetical protein
MELRGDLTMAINLNTGARAQRKTLITVAEWKGVGDTYALQTMEPADWSENFKNYYVKSGATFVAVDGETAPSWAANTYYTKSVDGMHREILGARTEDSAIEFNPDSEKVTDILGITYTDVNKTEPQQDFDPFYLMGGSALGEYLADAALKNDIAAYNNVFNVYIITAFIGEAGAYKAVKHSGCSIIPTSIGGDSYVSMPIEVHFSNNITAGTVDKLGNDFVFTAE